MMKILITLIFILSSGTGQKSQPAEYSLLGTWHGTSICVDPQRDSACKDEEVVYVVNGIPSVRDTVEMEAFKIINDQRVSMGILSLAHSQGSRLWTVESQDFMPSGHIK